MGGWVDLVMVRFIPVLLFIWLAFWGCENGANYIGEFKDGQYHGQGTLTYENGDGDGNVLHIQDSALLEMGKGYSKKNVPDNHNIWMEPNAAFVNWFHKKGIDLAKSGTAISPFKRNVGMPIAS